MKVGDKAKGFYFEHEYEKHLEEMCEFDGIDGTISSIGTHIFRIDFGKISWWYPINDYIIKQREEKFKELDI